MDLPQEIDDYIKESIEYSLGLPVSTKTLELKLQASEEARKRLLDQYFLLHSRLKEKDETIERSRSEVSMNAQALKKFVEENRQLSLKCADLLKQCSRWEKECSLYELDREALMEFVNEADKRANVAEIRVLEAEDELRRLTEELQLYKHDCEIHMVNKKKAIEELQLLRERIDELECLRLQGCDDSYFPSWQCSSLRTEDQNLESHILVSTLDESSVVPTLEGQLLDSVIALVIDKDGVETSAHAFLEANCEVQSCQRLLKIWERLRPSAQNCIALAAVVKTLQNDKEHLRINLTRAEEEVKMLFEENNILDDENKRLLRKVTRERQHQGSGGKQTSSTSAKENKTESSPTICNLIERIDLNGLDSPRQPFSPLQHNSRDSRMHKK